MDEDRLTPQMGRLIDEAKAAALRADPAAPRAEGVALLGEDGDIYIGYLETEPADPAVAAAESALASARRGGCQEILAAAVAVAGESAETLLPGSESYRVLAGIDPDLPLVVKYQGRWVMLPLSRFTPPE